MLTTGMMSASESKDLLSDILKLLIVFDAMEHNIPFKNEVKEKKSGNESNQFH